MFNNLRVNETLIILCIEGAIMMLGMGLASPILPLYARDFGLNITMVGFIITIFAAARAVMDIPSGRISDVFGRRPTLIAGPVLLSAGSFGCGLATEFWQLLICRAMQGAGSGLFNTASMVMLADISTASNRGSNMSISQGCLWVGFGLGPFIGGFIGQYFGMRSVFYIYGVLSLLSALWAYLRLPETRPSPDPDAEVPNKINGHVTETVKQLKTLLVDANFMLICLVSLVVFMMSNGSRNQIFPLLASERLHIGAAEIGIALSIIAGINVIFMFISGHLSDNVGRKPLILLGCIFLSVSLIMIAFSYSYLFLVLSCVTMGIGTSMVGSIPAAYLADILTSENRSTGLSIFRALSDLGLMVGPVLLGWLADIAGYNFPLYAAAAVIALAATAFQAFAHEHLFFHNK